METSITSLNNSELLEEEMAEPTEDPIEESMAIMETEAQDISSDSNNVTLKDVDESLTAPEVIDESHSLEETLDETADEQDTSQTNDKELHTSVISADTYIPKKRGRPPKKKLKVQVVSTQDESCNTSVDDSSVIQEPTITPIMPRKRGRPRKKTVEVANNKTSQATLEDESIEVLDVSQGTDQTPLVSPDVSTMQVTPRKRGRPPKSATKADQPLKKRGRPKSKPSEQELFTCIFEGKSSIQNVVSEWVSIYQKDPEAAVLELIQYFVRCSGCQAVISPVDFRNEEASVIIRKLTENFAEQSFDYPLIMSGPQYKKFKSNYSDFCVKLINGCGESILFDEFMLDSLVMWLIGLSDSQVRAFRHTSTLAALKLVTGLIGVANKINGEIDNTQRQCETERRRSSPRRAVGKLSKLEETLSTLQQQSVDLHEMINSLFTSVFVHRYRDTRPELRSICIAELGVWMKEYSSQFLSNNFYIKYIGWTLSDKVADVRLQSLLALEPLYATREFGPHLELFTQRFKERIISMKLDKEDSVAIAAIGLSSHLLSLDMLDPEECVEICELVFMDNKHIARAAGKFAVKYLFSEEFMTKASRAKPPKGHKKPTDSHIKLRELLRFFLEAKIHHHAEYIVDSLWEHTDILQDWETITDMLMNSSCGLILTNDEETALIEFLSCAVRRAAGASLVFVKTRLSAKDKKVVESDKESLAGQLIPVISELIAKYGTDNVCAANLTSIPQSFELEFYVELRAQKHLEDLLTQLKELMFKHSTPEVLQEISATYSHLLDTDFTFYSVVNVSFGQLTDQLFTHFKEYLEVLNDRSMVDDDNEDVFNLSVTLKRICYLFMQINLTSWSFTDEVLRLIEMGIDGNASDMLVIPSLTCLHLHLLWSLATIDNAKPDRSQLRNVRNLTQTLVKHCSDLVKLGSPSVQQEAFIMLCDLLIVFAKQLSTHGELSTLVYTPNSTLQSTLCEYIMEKVFNDTEIEDEPTSDEEALAQAEKLNDRRVLLSGYLKLVIYSVIDINSATSVLAQYFKFYSDCGDLIRTAFTHSREADPVKWYKAVLLCLQEQFKAVIAEDFTMNYDSVELANLKDLARKIALTTGFDLVKCRLPVVGIIHDGIKFALQHEEDADPLTPPANILFFEVISEFVFRLFDTDRLTLITFLKKQFDEEHPLNEVIELEGWEKLHKFAKLISGPEGIENTAGSNKKGRGTKRNSNNASDNRLTKTIRRKSPHEE